MPNPLPYTCKHCGRVKRPFDPDWRLEDGGLLCPGCYRLLTLPSQKVLPEVKK